jgi:class 3 adenylate cyclase
LQWLNVGHAERVAWISAHLVVRSAGGCDETTSSLRLTGVLLRQGPTWLVQQLHFSSPTPAERTAGFTSSLDAITAVVEQERVDLCNCAAPDGTVTLLFTDIENSTPIAEELGDLRWIELLREHNRIVRECLVLHGGEEVKTIGDAFMVAFGSARRALLCAIAIQRAVAAGAIEDGEGRVRVRIGLHPGEPVREGNDFYGKSVVLASRIAGQARGGEILVSSLLRELAESAGDIRFDDGQERPLKSLAGQHRLYAVLWA